MKTVSVTCDHCQRDLTRTTGVPGFRLVLRADSIPVAGGQTLAIPAVHIVPPLDDEHHFCGLTCLEKWVDSRRAKR